MSEEERTQAPSQRRRQEAREQGVVARSPELTASVGLLAAVVLLGMWGGTLTAGLLDLVRSPFVAMAPPVGNAGAVAGQVRSALLHVFVPAVGILGGVLAAMIAAHQAQVGGLWAPSLIAPDLARVWSFGGLDWGSRAGRGLWGIAKAAVVIAVVAWAIRRDFLPMLDLSHRTVGGLAAASGAILKGVLFKVGLATLLLGLADYLMVRGRIEAMLRVTPDQQREDQKAVDGDPAVRSRRQQVARSWRSEPSDLLAGAVLVVAGPGGLSVVLGGEGPPGKVTVRGVGRGASGAVLRRSAEKAGLPVVPAPAVAEHFAGASARSRALPASLAQELAAFWPASRSRDAGPSPI